MYVTPTLKNYLNWLALAGVLLHFLVFHQGGISSWIACQHHNGAVQIENMAQHQAFHHHTHHDENDPTHQHESPASHPENSVSQNKTQEVKDLNLQFLLTSLTFQTIGQPSLLVMDRNKLVYQDLPVAEKPPPWSYPLLKQSTILLI